MTNHKNPRDFLVGQMLIAMPNMGDPRFERSVVLVCSHENDHAMGIVVNKRLQDIFIGNLLQQLKITAMDDVSNEPVFHGGPVQQDRGLVIHTLDYISDKTLVVDNQIGITGTREILNNLASEETNQQPPKKFLLALGHAGWSGGQLEEEIQMNVWAHVEMSEDIIFSGAKRDSWSAALEQLGVSGAMLSEEWMRTRDTDALLN